jgi:non-specific protein-tyrosine kinase
MEAHAGNEAFDLRDYLAVLKRRKWTILAVALLVIIAALGYSFGQTPLYEGTTRLLVRGVPADASGYTVPVNLQTEGEVVTSEPVASRVIEQLDLDLTPQALIRKIEVTPTSQLGEVLLISHTSPQPQLARDLPNAFAQEYIDYKADQANAALNVGLEAITSQIDELDARFESISTRLQTPSVKANPELVAALQAEQNAMIARMGILQQRLDDYQSRTPGDIRGGELIESATLPSSPASPDHLINGLRALVLGIALGIGLAFVKERLDDQLRSRQELERATGLPVLGTVPRFTTSGKTGREVITLAQPRGTASEAYRSLRTGLNFLSKQQALQSLLLTSPSEGEGKTITCINLAVAFAQSGRRVMLVSADLRRPTLEDYFGLQRGEGLTRWLTAKDSDPWDLIRDPGIDHLRVIPSGPIPSNPAELLSSPRLTELIEILEDNSDIVLIDSPPVLAVADAAILSTHVDGTILVADATKTHRSAAARAAQELQSVGARLLGTIYNGFDASSAAYGVSYYRGAYESHAGTDETERRPTEERRKSVLSLRR